MGRRPITSVPNYNVIELWHAPRSVRLALRSSAADLLQWSGVEGIDTARYEAAFALAREQFEGIKM